MGLKNLAYNVCHPLLRVLRSNHFLIRRAFGVKLPRGLSVQYDPTTLILSHTIIAQATPDDRSALEIGIGTAALLSLSLALKKPIAIEGVDCSPSRVASSQTVAEHNNVAANFMLSDLFSAIPMGKRYDLIFFNPPYVPTQTGRDLKLTERLQVDGDQMWDGGEDGTQVLRQFLKASHAYLTERGRVIFGVQNLFVPDDTVLKIIAEYGYQLNQRCKRGMVPATAYVICRPGLAEPGLRSGS